MNFVARVLSSSMSLAGLLIKLSVNLSARMAPTRWCMAISGIKFMMPMHTLLNLPINARRDSPFSCFVLRRDKDDVWWGLLVAYYMMNFVIRSLKLPTELVESWVNQPSGPSWREVGNTLHHNALSVVYKVICVLKTFRCSSGSVEPS